MNLAGGKAWGVGDSVPRPSRMFTTRVSQVTDDNLLHLVMSDLEDSLYSNNHYDSSPTIHTNNHYNSDHIQPPKFKENQLDFSFAEFSNPNCSSKLKKYKNLKFSSIKKLTDTSDCKMNFRLSIDENIKILH